MRKSALCTLALTALCVFGAAAGENGTVNVFAAKRYEADEKLYAEFEAATGIAVNVISGKAPELIERIRGEGENTQADLFITVDGGVLGAAKRAGILQPVRSPAIDDRVPAQLRDPEYCWLGLSTRCRIIVYSKARVKPSELSTYAALTGPEWRGKVLVRSSAGLYDQSLLASFIILKGAEEAEKWAAGIVANMARDPQGNDRDQAKAVAAGQGDVAIMNTYYIGQMLNSKDPGEVEAAKGIGLFFPDQDGDGAHVNISGIGLVKHAKNRDNAVKLIEYLLDVPVQERLAAGNYEFPVNPKAQKHELLKSWGDFKTQQLDFNKLGEANPEAVRIFDKVGWK